MPVREPLVNPGQAPPGDASLRALDKVQRLSKDVHELKEKDQ